MRSGCAGFSDTPALFVHQLTNELLNRYKQWF